jgi:hypothetical protein
LSTGRSWPDGPSAPQGKTLVLSAEDGISDTIKPRVERLGGDPTQIVVLRGVLEEHGPRSVNLARDLGHLSNAIRRVEPLMVVIDPITAYLGKTDSYKDAEVRGLLAPMLTLLESNNVALLAVGHLAKSDQRAALHRPGGSIAFVAAARIVLCLAPDPDDADRRVLARLKGNLGPPPPSLAFRLPDGRIEWEPSPVTLDAETILRPAERDREDQTDARDVIKQLLADEDAWPMYAEQVLAVGEAHGISERTMRRTARKMGIQPKRIGFGEQGRWVWHRQSIADTRIGEGSTSVSLTAMAPMENQAHIGVNNNIEDTTTCTTGAGRDGDDDYRV